MITKIKPFKQPRPTYEERKETLLLANADYEDRKFRDRVPMRESMSISVRSVEREWKLKAGSLTYFRGNKNRRKYSAVFTEFAFMKYYLRRQLDKIQQPTLELATDDFADTLVILMWEVVL